MSQASSIELKPCPFCGGPLECTGDDSATMYLVRVYCGTPGCTLSGAHFKTRAEAIAAANTRVEIASK